MLLFSSLTQIQETLISEAIISEFFLSILQIQHLPYHQCLFEAGDSALQNSSSSFCVFERQPCFYLSS